MAANDLLSAQALGDGRADPIMAAHFENAGSRHAKDDGRQMQADGERRQDQHLQMLQRIGGKRNIAARR
ncbi:hypothetical protein D3C71_1614290 [compost metagenome]